MSFSDPDPLEQDMKLRVEEMTASELVTYIKTYHEAFGRVIAIDGWPEMSVFKGMKRIYGDQVAGQIVKWVFYRYKGVYQGDIITPLKFAKGRKWWVDIMHQELQNQQRKEATPVPERVSVGARRLSDL